MYLNFTGMKLPDIKAHILFKFYLLRGVCLPPSDMGVEYPPSFRCLALAHSSAIRLQSFGSADCTGGLGADGFGLLWTIGVSELG